MATTVVKPTDPAAEPSDEAKARIAFLAGEDTDYTQGTVTAHVEDDTYPVGHDGGIRHFDGTVVKINADGDHVLSSYVDPSAGEKLLVDEQREEDLKARAAGKSKKSAAGKSPDTKEGQSVGGDKPKENAGAGDNTPSGGDGAPPVITTLPA